MMRMVAEMRFLGVSTLLFLACLTVAPLGGPLEAQVAGGFAIQAGRVYSSEGVLEDATIIVRGSKVVAVGIGLEVPSDLQLLRFPDGVITTGLVAAAGDMIRNRTGQEAISAAYLAIDEFDRYGDFRPLLASGVTTVHLSPGDHRLLSGQGAVVKVAGSPNDRVLKARSDLSITLTDRVDDPAPILEVPVPASADTPILPPTRQRPTSRIGRLLALGEELDRALGERGEVGRDRHLDALAEAWTSGLPLRIVADGGVDLIAGVSLLRGRGRQGYLVGVADLVKVWESLASASVPLVVRPRRGAGDIGFSVGNLPEGVPDLTADYPGRVALGPPAGQGPASLRWSGVLAASQFKDPRRTVEMMTSVPAQILGVADRVGAIAKGLDADLVVWTDDPWKLVAQPREVFVSGRLAWQDEKESATVVRAQTIWLGPENRITDGEILVEDGRIVAVGHTVPHPPRARVIDASEYGFVTPGFIDANGHLGLRGDQTSVGTNDRLVQALGVPDVQERVVASSGVTTVLLAPYRISRGATTSAAIKTMGRARTDRVVREVAAVIFEVGGHPKSMMGGVESLLGKGRKYIESWKKYEKAFKEYEKKVAAGEKVEAIEIEEVVPTESAVDPITGVWSGTLEGGPLPEPQEGKMSLTLTGSQVEGRVIEPEVPIDHRIVGTLDGSTIEAEIEVDGDLPDVPKIKAELTGEDEMAGTISVMGFSIDFVASRTSKEAVEFKVERRRRKSKDGKPSPPAVDPALEPIRMLLEGKIPAVVRVSGTPQIERVIEFFREKEKLSLVLIEGDGSRLIPEKMVEKEVGLVLPVKITEQVRGREYNASDHLSRAGVSVAFQSNAGDGARNLPMNAREAVERGLAPDAALEALTRSAARLMQIDDRVGAIEVGRDADLLIFDGHPFESGSRLERVLVNGEEVQR